MVPSALPEINLFPSGLNRTEVTEPLCPVKVLMFSPSSVQSLIVLSLPAVAINFPSGLKVAAFTGALFRSRLSRVEPLFADDLCPERLASKVPSVFHNFTIPSLPVAAIKLPLGLKLMLVPETF